MSKLKTRFTQLVALKKDIVQKSEQALFQANQSLQNAQNELQNSYDILNTMHEPTNGSVSQLLANRTLLSSQRGAIQHNKEWIKFAQQQVNQAKEQLQKDMIEYEKFKYLELEEIKKILKAQKQQEAKDLDEVALMTYKG